MTLLTELTDFAINTSPTTRGRVLALLIRFRRLIDRGVAISLASIARQAELAELHRLDDRQLKDIGLYRSDIGEGLPEAIRVRARLQRSLRS